MIRCGRNALIVGMLVLVGVPALEGFSVARADVTGDEVRRAVQRGTHFIRRMRQDNGRWVDRNYPGGATALATLALLQAGTSPDAGSVRPGIEYLRSLPDTQTYVVGLKIMVLARADGVRYRREIGDAAKWLMAAQNSSGLWNYTERGDRFDHSNTQFALLGLHEAAQVGVDVPPIVWRKAERRLLANQNSDGGWAYQARGGSFGSMTAAGVADLLILGYRLEHGQEKGFSNGAAPRCGRYRVNQPLAAGLAWLGENFRAGSNPQRREQTYYWLYAVERCGILSGQRYFGAHDWYRAGAEYLVRTQDASGAWQRSLVNTCFAVLFLAKGHKSLLIQKLKWSDDDAWQPDRYDVAHLVAFIDDQLGQPVAWQVVPRAAALEDWLAAPILYFHGHVFPEFSPQEKEKLRAFVEQGGTLLAEACCGRREFRAGFEKLAREVFAEAPLRELGDEHAVYRVVHKVRPYGLRGIDLGCRTAVIYSPRDLSCLWEQGDIPVLSERAFQIGTNIAAYAVGRRPLRDRLDAVVVPLEADAPALSAPPARGALQLGQVVYEGDWRPFPYALTGLAEFLRDELSFDVVTRYRTVRLREEQLRTAPILFMAGHYAFELSGEERVALREHLRRGGTLIADACCGTEPFGGSFRRLMREMFPEERLERLSADHAIFAGQPGFDVTTVSYTADVLRAQPGRNTPELWGLALNGRLAVIYSPFSLSCGLSGPAFDGCWGLVEDDARRLAANIVLYALTH